MPQNPSLSPREREVLELIVCGASTREIATQLGLSESTIWTHRESISKKLKTHSPAELVRAAIKLRLVGVPQVGVQRNCNS